MIKLIDIIKYQIKKLENAWEFKLNLIWDENLKSSTNFEENMRTGLKLFQFIGEFRTKGIQLVLCTN